jgi:hypothetical protein
MPVICTPLFSGLVSGKTAVRFTKARTLTEVATEINER